MAAFSRFLRAGRPLMEEPSEARLRQVRRHAEPAADSTLADTGRPSTAVALGRRNHEAGAWKMHTDFADRGFAASDDDLMDARGDQFADDRIASGIVRSNADDLAKLPPDGIFRVGGCFRD